MIRSRDSYTTFLVWPYAIAPAIAGVLWWFTLQPLDRHHALCAGGIGLQTGTTAPENGTDAMILIIVAAA